MRLDIFVHKRFPGFSRSFLKKFIEEKGVRVNGVLAKKVHLAVAESDRVELEEKELQSFLHSFNAEVAGRASAGDFPVLFEDDCMKVIDKPAGIRTETIARGYFAVHRLDRDTSGVLVLAKDLRTLAALQDQWKARTVKKTYTALLKGELTPRRGEIEAAIARNPRNRLRMILSRSSAARPAQTAYKVLKYGRGSSDGTPLPATLVEAYPKTGRTHQIRLHFSGIGHPVLGDTVYGERAVNKEWGEFCGLTRQFLHANKLALQHPQTKKAMIFSSPLAGDLEVVLKACVRKP